MKAAALVIALFSATAAIAQQKPAELTGTVSFDVESASGRVERVAVQIGDGGRGPYKAILAGDSSLPTHTIYRPRDLAPFGPSRKLPLVVFGNGGCRNGSGEFRNFLSDIASYGYLVVAIGPAGDSVVGGGEGRTGMTAAVQLLDGLEWATKENARTGGEYHEKLDTGKVAAMGQSCGTWQASEVSTDPRITTTVLLNGGGAPPPPRPSAAPPAQGQGQAAGGVEARGGYGNAGPNTTNLFAALDKMALRYAPYAPKMPQQMPNVAERKPVTFHGPVLYMPGGPSDLAYEGARAAFEAEAAVPAVLAWQDVGHYPATYRQPHGGAFAVAATAWLDWQLKGAAKAREMFVGPSCGLCQNQKWTVRTKNIS
jgi:hypothetical protein